MHGLTEQALTEQARTEQARTEQALWMEKGSLDVW